MKKRAKYEWRSTGLATGQKENQFSFTYQHIKATSGRGIFTIKKAAKRPPLILIASLICIIEFVDCNQI